MSDKLQQEEGKSMRELVKLFRQAVQNGETVFVGHFDEEGDFNAQQFDCSVARTALVYGVVH
tara:strand:- start:65 stop:250 length:186 start_codon:yes stop_codon:yes gene_type:complete